MTNRGMLNSVPGAFPGSNIAQCDDLPSAELILGHFVKRASDGGMWNLLRASLRYQVKRLRDVNVRSFQTLALQRHVDDRIKANIRQVTKLFQHRTLDSDGFLVEPVQRDQGRTIRRFGQYLI